MRPALFSECDDTALVTGRAERTLAALAFEPDGSRSVGRPFGRARIRNAFRLSATIPGPEVFCLLSAGACGSAIFRTQRIEIRLNGDDACRHFVPCGPEAIAKRVSPDRLAGLKGTGPAMTKASRMPCRHRKDRICPARQADRVRKPVCLRSGNVLRIRYRTPAWMSCRIRLSNFQRFRPETKFLSAKGCRESGSDARSVAAVRDCEIPCGSSWRIDMVIILL